MSDKEKIENESNTLLANILAILNGINQTETESDDGWWETSTGAEFGAKKLAEIKSLFG